MRDDGLAQVGEQRAALQAAGGVRREQPRDAQLATRGLAAERELAVDDRRAQRSLGVVVGRLDAGVGGERPQRRPGLQEVARHAAAALVARALRGEGADDRLVGAPQGVNRALQLLAVTRVDEDLPCPEDALAQLEAGFAELLLGGEPFGVRLEVAPQMGPAQLAASK